MKKSPLTDNLDDIISKSGKLIDEYQKYEKELARLMSFSRNYINEKYITKKLIEVQAIKEKFEVFSTDFKYFKTEYWKEFDCWIQEYLDRCDDYFIAVMYSINQRIILQNVLLNKSGTLFGNISLILDMKNAVSSCLQSGIEVNKTVMKMKRTSTRILVGKNNY